MLSAFTNCFKIPELRQRIFLTLGLIFIARVGAGIPLPGIDPAPLQAFYASSSSDGGGLVGLYNMFTGGAMVNGALFALGIMPYISASIILQLMGAVMPSLARLMQEGDSGRQKIAQYTRYLTLVIAAIQGTMLIYALVYSPETIFTGFDKAQYGSILIAGNIPVFFITSVFFMTTGCMILTWLGEQITQRGVGNGVSIIITVGIIETLPGAVSQAYQLVFNRAVGAESAGIGMPQAIMMLVLLVVVTVAIIMILQAVRKVPVQYAKRLVGRKLMGGQSSYLPLKVNYAGVMPIIFASAILLFPQQIFGQFNISTYSLIYGGLVFAFSYFWVSIMFKPLQISDELKRNGGYIPGVRPGEPTAKFLDYVMTRLTFAGALFLVVIAVLPSILMNMWGVPQKIAYFFGGTSALIAVGVSLDTMRQVETYLLQRHYDGFLKKGRIRGRSVGQTRQMVDTREIKNLWALWTPLLIIFFVGLASWVIRKWA
ncbi:protein translocase subunit SecY [Coraliomargarita sp. CAG:312]|nr:protein translocase subunit SecY [Coraliomargarita sp. CAG:312]